MSRSTLRLALFGLFTAALGSIALAQPVPGDVFREYIWFPDTTDAGGSLRVGGRLGDSHPDRGSDHGYINAPITLPQTFDLEHAIKAEVVIEKLLCHDGTRGLAIQVNGHNWIDIPETATIPSPQWDYQHHTYPVVSIPLTDLKPGTGNTFRLKVSPEQPWKWPQNLIYGVHFRVYYDIAGKPHPTGTITSLKTGDTVGLSIPLEAATSTNTSIRQVDYIAYYDDVNYEGDGQYRQWHYHYYRGQLLHHLGTATSAPYRLTWDTSWVPDQNQPIKIAARITDTTGLTCITPAIEDLKLVRPGLSVELCKPYDVPKRWVTRSGELQEKFQLTGDLKKAVAAQLVWCSWSPGYMNGLYLNDQKVFDTEGPRYAYYFHRVALTDLTPFRPGENILKTGLTPKHNGQMVHGMEVNWPGIMVLVQYRTQQ